MALIRMQAVSLAFGGPLLLDSVNLQIERGERVCILGRNGAGKSTLMRLIHGDFNPDSGEIVRQQGVRIALLPQEAPRRLPGTVRDIVAGGVREAESSGRDFADAWRIDPRVEKMMSRMNLSPAASFEALSAGLKRRVLLARGLVEEPDILLLDEPTNHLDIESIGWMEDFLIRYGGTLLFVTHDRMLLQRLATRIVELDRGRIIDWSCDWETFRKRREAILEAESGEWSRFDRKLAGEEEWIRRGIKARRTRNEGRVRQLEKMRKARAERRERPGTVRMRAQEAERPGKVVIAAEEAGFGYEDGERVVSDFSTLIMRGDRVGIIGPNGSGKTTLLRLLIGELHPREGRIRRGTGLEIAYFDQLRVQLEPEKTVSENVGEGNDTILFNGKPKHVIGYLRDFLFSPERARSPVRILSGGERNRLMLAKLFTKPSNVLVMDEPTNDLDTETLELLEELLLEYPGTLLLVSHDRAFLNNVVTSTLVMEEDGKVGEYVGGYDDWLRQRKKDAPKQAVRSERERPKSEPRRRLGFKEQRELESLPKTIETLESEQRRLYETMSDPAFYRRDGAEIAASGEKLKALELEIAEAYRRWETLEALKDSD